jgi:hypothetical protein
MPLMVLEFLSSEVHPANILGKLKDDGFVVRIMYSVHELQAWLVFYVLVLADHPCMRLP